MTAVDTMAKNHQTVQCQIMTETGQALEDCSGHIDRENRRQNVRY